MSTRSNILVEDEGKIKWVYCHFDGYPEHVGQTLLDHYNAYEDAMKIISLGDLSSLDNSCECPEGHSFNNRVDGYTVAYGRDRGEEGTEASECDSIEEYHELSKDGWHEYIYLWRDGKWNIYYHGEFMPLADYMKLEATEA